ncbi:hypothetical protein [Actinosynnema pretiosum]|uniref:Uncharacterized protein n=1 Tax=Actinosynnema pretiosum TaxID=42197 RepID=A0A290Z3V3_9PSEU|nr:hypothetical protein [Actinosynnema pretiosum]ATE53633.1 hypothetical protein CNX65_10290 [Actinosynnema pretiosum]
MAVIDRRAVRIAADAEAKIRVADAEAARKLEAQRARIELERLQAEADRVSRAERDVERRAERSGAGMSGGCGAPRARRGGRSWWPGCWTGSPTR